MSELALGLLIRNTSGNEENMKKIRDTIEVTMSEIKNMGPDVIDKMSREELNVMVNKRVLEAVQKLNISGIDVVPANEAGLDMMPGTSEADRVALREQLAEIAKINFDTNIASRAEAVHSVAGALAKYAMQSVEQKSISGPGEMFHDFGQIAINAITEIASGATSNVKDDKLMPEAAKLFNRIAVISMLKMILTCDDDQAVHSAIDKTAIMEDLKEVVAGNTIERLNDMVKTLHDYTEVHHAHATGAKFH